MDWIKQYWDRVILTLAGLAAVGLAVLFVLKSRNYPETFLLDKTAPKADFPPVDFDRVASARKFLDADVKWVLPTRGTDAPKQLPLFMSVPIVEVAGQLIDMNDPKARPVRPPASNQWLLQYELNFLDGGVMSQDPDNDQFSNEEEWNAKTDPRDAGNHPPYSGKLHLVARRSQSYVLQFVAMPDDQRFQIVRLPSPAYPGRQNFMLRVGDTSPDGIFRVDAIEKKQARSSLGITVDASELTITYLPTGETKKLTRGVEEKIQTFFGEFEFELGKVEPQIVKKGDSFTLLIDPSTKYKLVDIQEQEAEVSYSPEPGKEIKLKIVPKK